MITLLKWSLLAAILAILTLSGCAPSPPVSVNAGSRDAVPPGAAASTADNGQANNAPQPAARVAGRDYQIGSGDQLQIFVWRHNDVSAVVPVRPDGRISTPLVEDMQAAGKTPTELARDVEAVLAEYIKNPVVTVIVTGFVGDVTEHVRVVGQAMQPRALPYRTNLTLLDVMIEVGGLAPLAAGRRAKIIRRDGTEMIEIDVRPDILLDKGDLRFNVKMLPGDVLIIPEARF